MRFRVALSNSLVVLGGQLRCIYIDLKRNRRVHTLAVVRSVDVEVYSIITHESRRAEPVAVHSHSYSTTTVGTYVLYWEIAGDRPND